MALWVTKAAEQGDANVQINLGLALRSSCTSVFMCDLDRAGRLDL